MTDSDLLLICLLVIVVLMLPFLALIFLRLKASPQTKALLVELLRESNQVNRSLTHLLVSRDFQTYAGLQSLSQAPLSQSPVTIHSPNTTSEYIPRDDVTEAQRLKNFGAVQGYGETIFDEETTDEELKEAIIDMVASGQIDFGEEGFR